MGIPCDASASWFAKLVGGVLHGEDQQIHELVPLGSNKQGSLSFVQNTADSSVFSGCLLVRKKRVNQSCIVVPEPKLAMGEIIRSLMPEKEPCISPLAVVHPDARLADSVIIHPGAIIGSDCFIGERTEIFSNVILYSKTRIGSDCQIHAGTVVGGPGFAYEHQNGVPHHVYHGAGVIIEDAVTIGANCTVDQGMLEATRIGSHVKIDNQVHVGHNACIGSGTIIAAQVGISGSASIGRNVLLGGQVGISDHAVIEDGVKVAAKSGVHGILKKGELYFGIPALPKKQAFEILRSLRRLPRWMRQK